MRKISLKTFLLTKEAEEFVIKIQIKLANLRNEDKKIQRKQ